MEPRALERIRVAADETGRVPVRIAFPGLGMDRALRRFTPEELAAFERAGTMTIQQSMGATG